MRPTKIVDLFAGPGGLDVAAEVLGIPSVGIEWDSAACSTRRAARLETVEDDVRRYGPSDFPEADVLAGGPPCQTFSVASGTGAGRRALDAVLNFAKQVVAREDRREIEKDLAMLEDERTGLVLQPLMWALDAIEQGRPYLAIVLEQVPSVLPVWRAYAEALASEGYRVDCGILHAEEFGVPQTRRRAVLIARYGTDPVTLPAATHRIYRKGVARDSGDLNLLPWRAMADVLSRPSGFEVISNYGTGGDPKARGRRRSDEPSATVTGKISRNRIFGPNGSELERLSSAEAARLQTFPTDYPWSGGAVNQQIGNAVPPRLAMHILSAAFGWGSPSEDELLGLDTWTIRQPTDHAPQAGEQPGPAGRSGPRVSVSW